MIHPLIASALVNNLLKLALLGSTWVMYVLLALSVASIGAMLERWLYFRRHAGDATGLADRLTDLVLVGDEAGAKALLEGDRTIEASVLSKGLRWMAGGPHALADGIDGEMVKKKKEVERSLSFLGTIGANSPFVGLFGTVIGVIEAFSHLAAGTDKQAMDHVMSGIAEALIATAVGLFVAIPAVVAYNVFQTKIGSIEDGVAAASKLLQAALRSRGTAAGRVHEAETEDSEESARLAAAAEA